MTQYFGDFAEDATVRIPFNTFDSNDPSGSVTITDLADSDIHVHKDGGATQIATDGATVSLNFDGITGNHFLIIDTSAHADYSTGSDYFVRVEGTTVDAATMNAWIGSFSIENRFNAAADDLANSTDGLGALKTLIDAVQTVVDKIPLSDGTVSWNATALAAINTQADAAIVTYGLDHLVAVAVADEVVDDSIIAKIVDRSSTADWSSFVPTEDSLRAISENVNSIGSAGGAGFNFEPLSDDVLEDLINNAGEAVDKSTTPETVGIPVTGAEAAGWLAGDECTIALTTAYNGQHVIDSVSTNEIVIVASFTSETFGASDTIKRTIKGTRLVGTQDSGTFASAQAIDSVVHQIGDTGNAFTISYRYNIGGNREATEAVFTGFLNSGNDDGLFQAYNFLTSAWQTRQTLPGQAGSVNQTIVIPLTAAHTGTSGAELGQVLMRIKDDGSSSSPTLNNDNLRVLAVGTGRSGNYQNGQIWIDTVKGTNGSTIDTHGTAEIPCKTWANVVALVTAGLSSDVHVLNGSSITVDSTILNYSFFGDHWSLALGGQAAGGLYCQGATVTGIGTSASEEMHFEGCDIGTCTVEQGHFDKCGFTGTITLNTADDYEFHNCYDKTATAAIFTKTAAVNITAEWVDWSGSITLSGIQANSSYILAGTEIGDVILNGADGTVEVRGIYKSITDNRTGSPTRIITGAIKAADMAAVLVDTAEIGAAGAGLTDLGAMSDAMKAEVLAEVNTALNTAISELGVAAPTATPTIRTALMLMYMALRNKTVVQTSGTDALEIYNDAGTKITQKLITDDDDDYTEAEMS